jgi:hypothetical protein
MTAVRPRMKTNAAAMRLMDPANHMAGLNAARESTVVPWLAAWRM